MDPILKYYSRREIQNNIVSQAKNKEVGVQFYNKGFGKRPDILMYESDVLELAKQGVTSFHISEETWSDPMQLKPSMTPQQLNDLRIGWDCILDVDTKFIEYSKVCASLLIEAIKFHDVNHVYSKFSGGSGFHIGISSNSFPRKVDEKETKCLFPDGIRAISEYLKEMIRKPLSESILSLNTIDEIKKSTKKEEKDLIRNNVFDPFSVIGIDSILISPRHLYRSAYSINEKTNLISIPVKDPRSFNINNAQMKNIEPEIEFLKSFEPDEAKSLIIQAMDFKVRSNKEYMKEILTSKENIQIKRDFEIPKVAIKEDYFPPCIKQILKGIEKDGRKRAVFVLINFLKQMGWSLDEIEKRLLEWNNNNYEPLRTGYILSQISWHRKTKENILPPNCDNEAYYKDLGINCDDPLCKKLKNPVNYVFMKMRKN
ncbi:MAG: hypothetical protein PHT54_00380 [Candidatus Nanoarchaeia archaeon]|nr:hypothetical protein [Candidatus Nanoarchaeia archaeon]